jgi:hypothetical protein
MSILSLIVFAILAYFGYFLYKQKDTCKYNPVCYINKVVDLVTDCGIDPVCYFNKIKD